MDRLRSLHGRLGSGKVIRELVIGHITRVEEAVAQRPLPKVDMAKVPTP